MRGPLTAGSPHSLGEPLGRGLASFCRLAKRNVNRGTARSGSNVRPRYGADDAGTGLDATRYPPGLTASQ